MKQKRNLDDIFTNLFVFIVVILSVIAMLMFIGWVVNILIFIG